MGITQWITNVAVAVIAATSYPGICLLMVLESMIFPIPSEAVMPFAGFLIADGKMTFTGVIIASTLGSLIGSLISYYIGYYGGKPFLKRFGKFFLLDEHSLEKAEKFFAKRGDITILITRFIPVVRHFISIPAGFAKMNMTKFLIFTAIGAGIWNSFLMYAGYKLKSNWENVMEYGHTIDIVVVVVLAALVFYYGYKIYKNFKKVKN